MAQKEHVIYFCDRDGQKIPDDAPHRTRSITVDGMSYESDLCESHNEEFARLVLPFLGRQVHAPARSRARGPRSGWRNARDSRSEIRDWARQRGHKVSDRGRIPVRLVAEYEAHH